MIIYSLWRAAAPKSYARHQGKKIYGAIMQAAQSIESRPQDYEGISCDGKHLCLAPQYALGWIGAFTEDLAIEDGAKLPSIYAVTERLGLGGKSGPNGIDLFFDRLGEVSGGEGWRSSADACADALRLYAAKYHQPSHLAHSSQQMLGVVS